MPKVRVPLFSFRLLLFFCCLFLIAAAFTSGLLLAFGGGYDDDLYNPAVLEARVKAAGIPALLPDLAAGKAGYDKLDAAAVGLARNAAVLSLALVPPEAKAAVWSLPAGAAVPPEIIAGVRSGSLRGWLIHDANRKEYFYTPVFPVEKKEYLLVVRLREKPGFQERFLVPIRTGFTRVFDAVWYKPAFVLGVLVLTALLFVMSATAVQVARPVRAFTALLENWDEDTAPGKQLGFLRSSTGFVAELVQRRGGVVRATAPEPVLDQLLPVRQGYDYPGIETGAFFLKRLQERKDFHDIFSLPDGRLCLFRGEVSGHGHEASVATARMALAAQAYSRSFSEPAMVIGELNTYFHAISGAIALNLFVGFLDVKKQELLFSQAGGLPLYRFRQGEMTPFHLDIPPAGIIPPDMYRERLASGRLALVPGDLCALITDGILKVRNFDWEERAGSLLAGGGMIGARVIAFRNALGEAAESCALGDDIGALFFSLR